MFAILILQGGNNIKVLPSPTPDYIATHARDQDHTNPKNFLSYIVLVEQNYFKQKFIIQSLELWKVHSNLAAS